MMNLMGYVFLIVLGLMQAGFAFAQEPIKANLADHAFEDQRWQMLLMKSKPFVR